MIINSKNYKGFEIKNKKNQHFVMAIYEEASMAKTAKEIIDEVICLGTTARFMNDKVDAFTRMFNCNQKTAKEIEKKMEKIEVKHYIDTVSTGNQYAITLIYNPNMDKDV